MADAQSFEQLLKQLEAIVQRLESSELSLEEAIDAYQNGVALAKQGHQRLAEAERRIEEVTRGGELHPVDVDKVLSESQG
jgi:exodeoxyribonuclease VII small subunit